MNDKDKPDLKVIKGDAPPTTPPESPPSEPVAPPIPADSVVVPKAVLEQVVKMIDAGAQRAAWKGEELSTVGGLRDIVVALMQG